MLESSGQVRRAVEMAYYHLNEQYLNLMRSFLVSYLLQEQMLWLLIGLLSTNLLCFEYDEQYSGILRAERADTAAMDQAFQR